MEQQFLEDFDVISYIEVLPVEGLPVVDDIKSRLEDDLDDGEELSIDTLRSEVSKVYREFMKDRFLEGDHQHKVYFFSDSDFGSWLTSMGIRHRSTPNNQRFLSFRLEQVLSRESRELLVEEDISVNLSFIRMVNDDGGELPDEEVTEDAVAVEVESMFRDSVNASGMSADVLNYPLFKFPEIEIERAKHRMSERLRNQVRENERHVDNYRSSLIEHARLLDSAMNNLRHFDENFDKGFEELQRISDVKDDLTIDVNGATIKMTFENVVAEDVEEIYAPVELGTVIMEIDMERGRLLFSRDNVMEFAGYAEGGCCHPHQLNERKTCLGTAEGDVATAIARFDVKSMVLLVSNFVHTYNSDDHAGISFINENNIERMDEMMEPVQ